MTEAITISIKAKTWARDSHGLFDYESPNTSKSVHRVASTCSILRQQTDISVSFDEPSCAIARLERSEGHFRVSPLSEKMWYIVRQNTPQGYRLCVGDVIKLGRVKFRVKEATPGAYRTQDLSVLTSQDLEEESEEKAFMLPCRVCLREDYTSSNPLISPCNCSGTMKYIHLQCLQRWLKTKLTARATRCSVSYEWKSLICDLCMQPLPCKMPVEGDLVDLVNFKKPKGNTVILETLCKDKLSMKGLHVFSLKDKEIAQIGRNNDCQLKLTDISVSRLHANISYKNGCFWIQDLQSKFGTLVQVKRTLVVEEQLAVQIGRSSLEFKIHRPWRLFPSCCSVQFSPYDISTFAAPVLPINSGFPLSVQNPNISEDCGHFAHLIGANSSFEEEKEIVVDEKPARHRRNLHSIG